jgi:hypothetical protein
MKTGAIDERHGPVANSNEEDPPRIERFRPIGANGLPSVEWREPFSSTPENLRAIEFELRSVGLASLLRGGQAKDRLSGRA